MSFEFDTRSENCTDENEFKILFYFIFLPKCSQLFLHGVFSKVKTSSLLVLKQNYWQYQICDASFHHINTFWIHFLSFISFILDFVEDHRAGRQFDNKNPITNLRIFAERCPNITASQIWKWHLGIKRKMSALITALCETVSHSMMAGIQTKS